MKEKFSEVERIFLQAIDLPKSERPQFVANACGGDSAMKNAVMAVLGVEGDSHNILDNAPAAAAAIAFGEDASAASDDDGLSDDVVLALKRLALDRLKSESSVQAVSLAELEKLYSRHVSATASKEPRLKTEFFALASNTIRRVIVERIREGNQRNDSTLSQANNLRFNPVVTDQLEAIDHGVRELEKNWPEHASLFCIRYFLGLSTQEVSRALELSESHIKEQWKFAKAWMLDYLNSCSD